MQRQDEDPIYPKSRRRKTEPGSTDNVLLASTLLIFFVILLLLYSQVSQIKQLSTRSPPVINVSIPEIKLPEFIYKLDPSQKLMKADPKRSIPPIAEGSSLPLIEKLMYEYGSDKSRDDHDYTSVYKMIFGPIRFDVTRVMELGISMGQSLQAWNDYFPNAEVIGIDHTILSVVRKNLDKIKRLKYYTVPTEEGFLSDNFTVKSIGDFLDVKLNSFDIIIDDGPHDDWKQEIHMTKLFPFVKPGGFYIIEDVFTDGAERFQKHPETMSIEANTILTKNDAIWMDTLIGHRSFRSLQAYWKNFNLNRVEHNNHLLVIRKRDHDDIPLQINAKHKAMQARAIVDASIALD